MYDDIVKKVENLNWSYKYIQSGLMHIYTSSGRGYNFWYNTGTFQEFSSKEYNKRAGFESLVEYENEFSNDQEFNKLILSRFNTSIDTQNLSSYNKRKEDTMDFKHFLSLLWALKLSVSDLHYLAKNENFYSDHKFADELRDGIDEWIDKVNEICFLGEENPAIYSKDIILQASELIVPLQDNPTDQFKKINELIKNILIYIEESIQQTSVGEQNLIGGIAQDLQQRYGLIWRRIL